MYVGRRRAHLCWSLMGRQQNSGAAAPLIVIPKTFGAGMRRAAYGDHGRSLAAPRRTCTVLKAVIWRNRTGFDSTAMFCKPPCTSPRAEVIGGGHHNYIASKDRGPAEAFLAVVPRRTPVDAHATELDRGHDDRTARRCD